VLVVGAVAFCSSTRAETVVPSINDSTWYNGGGGTLNPADGIPTTGHLIMTTNATGSSSWTTYFTPPGTPVTLANVGDQVKLTWAFTPTGVNSASTSQDFRLAVVNTPDANRISSGSPGTAAYTGYAMFMNMATTLGNGSSFQLRERTNPAPGTGAFLATGSDWTGLANGASSGVPGYADATLYTFTFTLTHNAADGLDIVATMVGGSLNGTGTATVSFTDETPNGGSFSFNTFGIRPSSMA
jgi:hypothetical protein